MDSVLKKVKSLVYINQDDKVQDGLLSTIVGLASDRLLSLLPLKYHEVPKDLEYVIVEVSVKKFNRIGSEGMQSEAVEGHSATFSANDFEEYLAEIESFIAKDDEEDYYKDKVVRFL